VNKIVRFITLSIDLRKRKKMDKEVNARYVALVVVEKVEIVTGERHLPPLSLKSKRVLA
jgi:hypothetical protein